jgi:hypothetical protein
MSGLLFRLALRLIRGVLRLRLCPQGLRKFERFNNNLALGLTDIHSNSSVLTVTKEL